MRIEGLAHTDGLRPAEDIGDVLLVLGEDLHGEVDDRAGEALRRVRPGLRPGPQGGTKTRPRASRAKATSHGSPASGPGSAVIGKTIRSATSTSSAGIRGSAPANSRAASTSPPRMARRWLKALMAASGIIGASGVVVSGMTAPHIRAASLLAAAS
ncbi:hypothetical protein [Streptomyces incanus]|uniref:Uncharacterized protein n=1 Tax=Streptomyces incanus TaxID=887453 RepID=A0ABW0XX75_9ACTN